MNQVKSLSVSVVAILAVISMLAAIPGHAAAASPEIDLNTQTAQAVVSTPNPVPAGGPIVGDQSLFPIEIACMEELVKDPKNHMVNHLPAIGSAEHTDAAHSGVYPCATFTGDHNGPNQVFQYESQSNFGNIQAISFAGPYEAYVWGGQLSLPSMFVARVDPSSGAEIWRTYLTNRIIDGVWQVIGGFSLLKDGSIAAAQGPDIWRLDPGTGTVLAYQRQPVLGHPARDANWDGIAIAPDERGTILLKSQTRPEGCNEHFQEAMMVTCEGTPPNTTVVALDPVTLENIAAIELDQMVIARPIVTEYNDTIYMYLGGTDTIVRVIWDPETETLTQDSTWAPEYLLEGQGPAPAPGLMGKWVVASANADPSSEVPMCLVAVSQDDSTDLHRICPWGDTMPVNDTPLSFVMASPGTDPENNLAFLQDYFVGGVYAIHLDPESGEMEVAWYRPDIRTNDFFSLVGPADERVLISQYIGPDFDFQTALPDYPYTEGVIWVDEATGETLALSSLDNPSTTPGALVTVGYGGRIYTAGNDGTMYIYQVMPAPEEAESSAATETGDEVPTATMDAANDKTYTLVLKDLSDSRDYIYCELVFDYGDAGQDIYSTSPIAPCDTDWWDNLDLDAVAAELGANSVVKNGPQRWSMDEVSVMASEPEEIAGVSMNFGAVLPPGTTGGEGTPHYEVFTTAKFQYLVYEAGKPSYQLVDPDGYVYIIQGYKVETDQLATLGDLYQELPEGWAFQVVTPDEDLVLNLTPDAPIPSVQDEFDQIYIRIPGQ